MNVSYINPFIVATREVFDTMIHIPMTLGKPFLRDRNLLKYRVSASIHLSGPVKGIVVLNFSEPVALALIGGLTSTPVEQIDTDGLDALGEITSMIAGSAKKNLPGGLVKLGLPRLHQPPQDPDYPPGLPVIAIPCDTSSGRFLMEVSLREGVAVPAASPQPAPKAESASPPAAATPAEPVTTTPSPPVLVMPQTAAA